MLDWIIGRILLAFCLLYSSYLFIYMLVCMGYINSLLGFQSTAKLWCPCKTWKWQGLEIYIQNRSFRYLPISKQAGIVASNIGIVHKNFWLGSYFHSLLHITFSVFNLYLLVCEYIPVLAMPYFRALFIAILNQQTQLSTCTLAWCLYIIWPGWMSCRLKPTSQFYFGLEPVPCSICRKQK